MNDGIWFITYYFKKTIGKTHFLILSLIKKSFGTILYYMIILMKKLILIFSYTTWRHSVATSSEESGQWGIPSQVFINDITVASTQINVNDEYIWPFSSIIAHILLNPICES